MILKLTQNNATAPWNPNCGVESVNGIYEHIIRHSVKNSVFSRLCHISVITFTTVLKLIEGYVWTIWKCLESVLKLLKKFRGILSKILCCPENLVMGKVLLRIRYDSYIGIFRPLLEPFLKFLRKVPWKIPSFRVFQNPEKMSEIAKHRIAK